MSSPLGYYTLSRKKLLILDSRPVTPQAPVLADEPRHMSLESRIQSLLQMQGGEDSQEDETVSDNEAPPLPPPPTEELPLPPVIDIHKPPPLPDYPPEVR